jgi:hypothetical protein
MKQFFQIEEVNMLGKNIRIFLFMSVVFLSSGKLICAQTADFDVLSMRHGIYEGVSEPKTSESEALLDARNSAFRIFAAENLSSVAGSYDIKMISNGTNPADVIITTTGEASITFRLPIITGVEEVGRKIERTEDGYIARVLITISKEGREKAKKYVDQETTAFRAYRYFAGKFKLAVLAPTGVPSGYSDYSSWLENNCLIFEMKSDINDYLVQLDTFLRKIIRYISIFADNYDGKPVRIIYNNPDRFDEIATALQKNHINVSKENSRFLLSVNISLDEFRKQVENMSDSGELVIAGISNNENRYTHISSTTLNETARIARQDFGMNVKTARLPEQCLNGTYNDTEIINMLDRKTARYVLLLKSTAVLEPGIEAYRIPDHLRISYQCILYDSITEKSVYSDITNDVSPFLNNNYGCDVSNNFSIPRLRLEKTLNSVLGNL